MRLGSVFDSCALNASWRWMHGSVPVVSKMISDYPQVGNL